MYRLFPKKINTPSRQKKVMQPVSALPFPLPFEFFSPRHAGEQKKIFPHHIPTTAAAAAAAEHEKSKSAHFAIFSRDTENEKKEGKEEEVDEIYRRGGGEKRDDTRVPFFFSKINTCVPSSPSPSLFFPFMSPSLPFLPKKLRKKVPSPPEPSFPYFLRSILLSPQQKKKKNSSAKRFDGCLSRKNKIYFFYFCESEGCLYPCYLWDLD